MANRSSRTLDVPARRRTTSSRIVAACPFLLLVGAAPNAIAYDSKQFTTGQFFAAGIPGSIVLMAVVAIAVGIVWPLMGMPITTADAAATVR